VDFTPFSGHGDKIHVHKNGELQWVKYEEISHESLKSKQCDYHIKRIKHWMNLPKIWALVEAVCHGGGAGSVAKFQFD
jgi:hypothetical protein